MLLSKNFRYFRFSKVADFVPISLILGSIKHKQTNYFFKVTQENSPNLNEFVVSYAQKSKKKVYKIQPLMFLLSDKLKA